jgi:hypothetical protein
MNSTIITLLLVVSVVTNVILLWYCRNLIKFIRLTTDDMTNLYESVDSFKEHLTRVYGLETFYGDQTLKSLLDHTKQLSTDVGDFIEINQNLIYGEEDA